MKRIVLLVGLLAVVALAANAQTLINFQNMHPVAKPLPMPDYYPAGLNLYWDNFSYVTPGMWGGAGPGFWVDPASPHNTVAFVGGPTCGLKVPCFGTIKQGPPIGLTMVKKSFTPISVTMSAGWKDNYVTVTGYNNGEFVGTLLWKVTTDRKTFTFPTAWRVSQLTFTPDYLGNNATAPNGSAVIYDITLFMN